MINTTHPHTSKWLTVGSTLLLAYTPVMAAESATDNKKLKVVVLMGQSNMVGYAHPSTAWYLTQPVYVPPAKVAEVKSTGYNSSQFYWSGAKFAQGNTMEFNAKGLALIDERREIVKLWRGRYYANFSRSAKANNWNYKEWGTPPQEREEYKGMHMRSFMPKWLGTKVKATGVDKRIHQHIESAENKFHPTMAIKQIGNRDEPIAEDLKRVREIFMKGAKPEDFDALEEAIKSFGRVNAENRLAYTELVKKHTHLPIPERTHIAALGAVAGQAFQDKRQAMSHGPLSLGYTKLAERCGPEFPFGVTFERMVDGSVLLIKCAWGGKSLQGDFRPPSLATEETPTGIYWKLSMDHIRKVLADLGTYHPDYNAKTGYELAGLIWFQGWNDKGNADYGKQLVHFIKDFRSEMKKPKLPVVCGLLGHESWKHLTFAGDVNSGMLHAAQHPNLKGTVDIVNTVKYYPLELGFKNTVKDAYGEESKEYKQAEQIINRAASKDPVHYFGSAKFTYLTGDAMARSLANLMNGGEPTIHKEAAEISKTE